MKSIFSVTALTIGYATAIAIAQQPTAEQPEHDPLKGLPPLNSTTYQGCFKSSGSLKDQGSWTYQAMGWCQPWCIRKNLPVLAFTKGDHCLCGSEVPSDSDRVPDSQCNVNCVGFPKDQCGGPDTFQVYLDGLSLTSAASGSSSDVNSPLSSPSTIATPSSADSSNPTIVRIASTVFVTAPGSTSAQVIYTTEVAQPSSGPNKAGIAAGVVVGVVALCAIIGGVLLWLRQRRRKQLEEEHRRSAAINSYMARGEKPPSTAASLTDSRLEPSVMFQRRQSDGSIADNQDYSRRILKVTNPDGS